LKVSKIIRSRTNWLRTAAWPSLIVTLRAPRNLRHAYAYG